MNGQNTQQLLAEVVSQEVTLGDHSNNTRGVGDDMRGMTLT